MKLKAKIIFGLFLGLLISLWIWTLSFSSSYLLIGGSTSCNEFMQSATSNYKKNEVIYSSVGSQAGINSVLNKTFSAGFVSKDLNDTTLKGWKQGTKKFSIGNAFNNKKNNLYTYNFATDAIIIIYHPPKWFIENNFYNLLSFDNYSGGYNSINWLYDIYSDKLSWEDLARNINSEFKINLEIPHSKTIISTYTRESGSGTRDAFSNFSNVLSFDSSNVANSNSLMVNSIDSVEGSIGYISYAFNSKITINSKLYAAGINGKILGNPRLQPDVKDNKYNLFQFNSSDNKYVISEKLNSEAISKREYNFTRPFSLLFWNNSNHKNKKLLKDFLNYLWNDIDDLYTANGLIKETNIYAWG